MKSHDLARKLLSLPDLEVYTELQYLGNPNWEFKTEKLEGDIKITPTGLFLETGKFYVKGHSDKSPNDEPVIGSYLVFFNDGVILKDRSDERRVVTPTVKSLSTGESRTHEYGSYNMEIHDNYKVFHRSHDANVVLVTNKETYEANPLYKNDDPNFEHRYVDDIDYVKVLVAYDPDTWYPTYQHMTYWDAVNYGKSL